MKRFLNLFCFILALGWLAPVSAQLPNGSPLGRVADDFQKRLDEANAELAKHRAEVEAEKVPMTQRVAQLESEIIEARKEYDRVIRLRDTSTLNVTNLNAQIKNRQDTTNYISNLLDEFVRNSEGRLHQSEIERYSSQIDTNRNKSLNDNLSNEERMQARIDTLDLFVSRLEGGLGGEIFDATAVNNKSGLVKNGKIILLGSMGYFATEDGSEKGLADSQLNSASTVIKDLPIDSKPETIRDTIFTGEGFLPIDSTRGSAFKVEQTKETVMDHIRKGGPVMYPIVVLGIVAVLIGLAKFVHLSMVKQPSNKQVKKFLAALDAGDQTAADAIIKKTGGPVGKMMRAGAGHYQDPPSMMEEAMFETLLDAKSSLNSWIPFIKIAAAVEPLLGLLGTVTGMINTFKLITIFGTGDAATFSSGISESLLTTMYGLVTAIPALLMAAFLARKARASLDDMEKLAVRLMNHRNYQESLRTRGADSNDETEDFGGTASAPITSALPTLPETQQRRPNTGPDESDPGLAPSPA